MGRGDDRDRQRRLQRKRAKRAAKRASRGPALVPFGGPAALTGNLDTLICIDACVTVLGNCERFDDELRHEVLHAARRAGGIWPRLPFELEKFLCEGSPWSLTCADLEPVRGSFAAYDAQQAFARLWTLALTNEDEAHTLLAAAKNPDCAHRAALAFDALRICLDDPEQHPAAALQAIAREMEAHNSQGPLRSAYKKLLVAALASAHASAPQRAAAAANLARDCRKMFDQWSRKQSSNAWWQCGRLLLAEVFKRHAGSGHGSVLAAHPELLTQLFDAPAALMWMARDGAAMQPLHSIHCQSAADTWLRFLRQQIDPQILPFDNRVRYEIARLKLLRAHAHTQQISTGAAAATQHEFLAAFERLRALLAHGVPPAHRALPGIIEPLLLDFYIEAIVNLNCADAAFQTTEALLHHHTEDFRLACLYATGALARGETQKLAALKEYNPRTHVDAEFFVRCATIWRKLSRGAQSVAAVRALLFDPLDREHRKQCLIKLARQALRGASDLAGYTEELRMLLPYFERDNFVYRELRERTALESELVFFATMMGPLHNVAISLTESQSQQWVSHAREIAAQSPLGAKLVARSLKTPSRWFTLAPGIRSDAITWIEDFQRMPAATPASSGAAARPARPDDPARSQRPKPRPPRQPGLFDDVSP